MSAQTVPCPGCASPMEVSQEVCGACRRPRDELEIESGRELLRERARRRRRLPLTIARRGLAVAALALAFRHRAWFLAYAAGWNDEIQRDRTALENPAPGGAAPKTAMGAAIVAMMRKRAAPPPQAAAPRTPRVAARIGEPPPPDAGMRRLYGIVYDVKTLQPVSGAAVRLVQNDSGATRAEVKTGADGGYQIDFPAADPPGLLVEVRAPGYSAGQLPDADPSYLEQTSADRAEAISETSPDDRAPVPLQFGDEDVFVPLDLVLIPQDAPR